MSYETGWPGDDVHVWRFPLDVDHAALVRLEATLDDVERARANRLRGELLRRRFVVGRGALRTILAGYLGGEPARIALAYGTHGKPSLAEADGLEFNLAHSGGLGLCAVVSGRAVGVDLEALRPMENAERIIGRYFTPREQAEFLAHAAAGRLSAFYRGWTRKEAFLKATGDGLAASLDSFEVSLGPDPGPPGSLLLRVGADPAAAGRWTLRELDAPPGFAAALAVAGTPRQIVLRDR
jgi:4'-phosphopantetheinyl transferase